jgi:pilus assembly protein Flp/PilA
MTELFAPAPLPEGKSFSRSRPGHPDRSVERACVTPLFARRSDSTERTRLMLHQLFLSVCNFIEREDGPTAVEYAVMLALIIVVCIAAITLLGQNAKLTFTSVGNSIGSAS